MKITRNYLARVAKNLLGFLDKEKIKNLQDLHKIIDQEFPINGDNIHIEFRPSDRFESTPTTMAYTVSYNVVGLGIPIEFKVSDKQGYSRLIVKGDFDLPDYENFISDRFGNVIKDKVLETTDIPNVRSELEKLAEY